MKNTSILLFTLILGSSAFGHELWVKAKNENILKAEIIYGHNFPHSESIPKDREVLFEPLSVINEKGNIKVNQEKEFYKYTSKENLEDGTYIIKAKYKPTAWIETKDNKWEMNKTRKDSKDEIKQCGIYSMFAKTILVVGDKETELSTSPVGNEFEITPLSKQSEIKEGVPVKFKVTKDGKPLKLLEVYGSPEGYSDSEMSMAFYAKTDLKGEFVFKALKKGFWYIKADYKQDSGNSDCELIEDKTTISFQVN
ncbi:DUF4198 domain-containing protein [Arcobacter cloacae]|uniref:Uncharacterized protein n=1 Tax=Arcobacter cloacae TaxID=1054034 RepID=A0A6M8NWN8_9BACT|nr:DUF4198 domain-containing protein [Arcobacter cloacae]QKF91186.1 DUF4198 domain-containing protein [Arcobacter cloacae]RXI40439.1 hypothetical protein CP963_08595 [Arcobacter cloacae]